MTDKELFGNSEQLNDTISRQAAIDALAEWHDEAITNRLNNLPSAQPSAADTNVATTDSISRAAVVDAIEDVDWYHININGEMVHGANDNDHQAWYKAEDIYKAVESVPPAQQWIPVTERLPERNGYYLVTGRQGAVNKRLYQDGYWYGNWTVFAWMPLPAPYQKGEK